MKLFKQSLKRVQLFIYTSFIASILIFTGDASAQTALIEPTLWGIYGEHSPHDCPVNNREMAKKVIEVSMTDLQPLMDKYGITSIEDMYHSGLEHTLLWVVKTTRPHDLEEFTIELGVASWNVLKFVPERTFADVIKDVTALHGLEDWKPESVTTEEAVIG